MLSRLDDYPIHQTPEPIAQPASSDRNVYDRYWFNGYADDGEFYFGIGAALYPNLGIMDCGFSIVRDGEQHAFHASRRAPLEPSRVEVGPVPHRHPRADEATPRGGGRERDGDLLRPRVDPAHREHRGGPPDQQARPHDHGRHALQPVRALARHDPLRRAHAHDRPEAHLRHEGPLVGDPARRRSRSGRRAAGAAAAGVLPVGAAPVARPLHAHGLVRGRRRPHVALGRDDLPDLREPRRHPGHRGSEHAAARRRRAPAGLSARHAARAFGRDHADREGRRAPRHRARAAALLPHEGHRLLASHLGPRPVEGRAGGGRRELEDRRPRTRWRIENQHIQQVVRATSGGKQGIGVLEQIAFGPHHRYGFKELLDPAK